MSNLGVKIFRVMTAYFLLGCPLLGQHEEQVSPDSHSYAISETGTMSQLGVHVTVRPLVGGNGISGFQVGATYQDPFYADSPVVNVLNPKFFHTSCISSLRERELGSVAHTNERKSRFQVQLIQRCKTTPSGLTVPFLEIRIRCSNTVAELRHIRARQEGRVFDITPTGTWEQVKTNTGQGLEMAQDAYNLASTIFVILDVVALSRGALSAGRFVLKAVTGFVQDEVVNSVFDYMQGQYGMQAEFHHTGWAIVCRLCGRRFHRNNLSDGELLRCTNTQCKAKAILHFH